jgi:hypothetical protein
MNLADLRRVTVKKRLRIRFALSNGMECILNEHGVAQIPALNAVPNFNLEQELAGVQQFVVETPAAEKDRNIPKPRTYTRDEMQTLTTASPGGEHGHDEHDD